VYGARFVYGRLIDLQGKPADKPLHFKDGVFRLVEQDEKIPNQIGRYYMLGKFYSAWLSLGVEGRAADPDVLLKKSISTRKEAGLTTDPKGRHDLFAALDSAFNKVEAMNPACVDSTKPYRERVYSVVYKKYDSTITLAKRALVVDPSAASPWNLMAQAYELKGDTASYRTALIKVTTVAHDSVSIPVRRQAYYNLAAMTLNGAKLKQGDERKSLAEEAKGYLTAFLKLAPDDPRGQSAMASAMVLLGDTAAARALSNNMMKNPDQYTAGALFEAGSNAYAAGQYDDAMSFYQAGLVKVPGHRDALFSMSSAMVKTQKFDEALPIVRRLLAVDPTDTSNVLQAYNVWIGVYHNSKDEALKGVAIDSIQYYQALAKSLPASVHVEPLVPEKDAVNLSGTVTNRGDGAKTFLIEFEFLNAAGAVVAKGNANVADVGPKATKPFSVAAKGLNVVAWRYKALN
jgi:tetratricopeptide (TPR) repeat protein